MSYEKLKHTTWDCKYHVIFIPKFRKKSIFGQLKRSLGPVFKDLARQKEANIVESHLMVDHVHMLCQFLPNTLLLKWWVLR